MNPRERKLALICGACVVLATLAAGYVLVYEPLQAKAAAANALQGEVQKLEDRQRVLQAIVPKMAVAKMRSLPADSNTARREYSVMLTRLLARAKIPQTAITVKEKAVADNRGIPLLANKKPAYSKVAYDIDLKNLDMWQVQEFLKDYYELNLLHQITTITLRQDDNGGTRKGPADRKDLSLSISTEAIIIAGAEDRRTLLPVPTAFAALGGWRGYDALAFNPDPEPARRITPFQHAPVLASRNRDYRFVVRRDMFHGLYPDPPAAALARASDVSAPLGQPISPVKLALTGDVPPGEIKWTARGEGKLLTEGGGSVKIDERRQTLSIATALGESGNGTVHISALLPNGKELKSSFKVSIIPPDPKADISAHIALVLACSRSDGTASAIIRDHYTPQNYEIEATPKGVKVQKFWFAGPRKREDGAPTPQLTIEDDNSGTKKVFKIIAIDNDGLIVADLTPPPVRPGMPAPAARFGKPPTPRMGDSTPEAPLAAAIGLPIAQGRATTKLYRWSVGQSLKQVVEIPKDEALRFLNRAAETGPTASTSNVPMPEPIQVPAPVPLEVAPAPRLIEANPAADLQTVPPPRPVDATAPGN